MSIMSLITETEKRAMAAYINRCAEEPMRTSIKHILTPWEGEKSKYLSKMFGDSLIFKKEVLCQKSRSQLIEEMSELLVRDESISKFRRDMEDYLDKLNPKSYFLYRVFSCSSLVDGNFMEYMGSHESNHKSIYIAKDKCIDVRPEDKPMRIIRKIAKEMNRIEDYEYFRIKHSQILNLKKLKGELCLSIHPLDYMTMSDNDCGWDSCMSWINEGSYRQGTVEMMNSPMVIVAYLTSNTDMVLVDDDGDGNRYTWNSKKWRQLFIVNDEIITNVKGYPYQNDFLTKNCIEWIRELAEKAKIGTYESTIQRYYPDTYTLFTENNKNIKLSFITGFMYSDFCAKNDFNFACISTALEDNTEYDICYSGPSECMSCGEVHCDFDCNEGLLSCIECYEPRYCDSCGSRVYDSEIYYLDGAIYCEYCFGENVFYCDLTKEAHDILNKISVFISTPDKKGYYTGATGCDFHADIFCNYIDYLEENFGAILDRTSRKVILDYNSINWDKINNELFYRVLRDYKEKDMRTIFNSLHVAKI